MRAGRQGTVWLVRAGWVGAVTSGALVLDAFTRHHPHDNSGPIVAAAWIVWAATLVAIVVPSVLGLAALRLAALVHLAGMIVAAIALPWLGRPTVAVVVALAAVFGAFAAPVGALFVNAGAYGEERRFLLRLPAALYVAAVVTTAVWIAAMVGALLAAAHRSWWALGALAVVVALGWVLLRQYRGLASRWLVVLPAAVVVHDPLLLAETVMVPRPEVLGAQLAQVGTGAYDLSGPASGHLVELTLRELITIVRRERNTTSAVHAAAVLVAPTQPGHAVAALNAAR